MWAGSLSGQPMTGGSESPTGGGAPTGVGSLEQGMLTISETTLHPARGAPRIIVGAKTLKMLAENAMERINPLNRVRTGRRQPTGKLSYPPENYRILVSVA